VEGLNRHPKKENAMPQYMFSVNHEVGEELCSGADIEVAVERRIGRNRPAVFAVRVRAGQHPVVVRVRRGDPSQMCLGRLGVEKSE
jgi:hypothetical protein